MCVCLHMYKPVCGWVSHSFPWYSSSFSVSPSSSCFLLGHALYAMETSFNNPIHFQLSSSLGLASSARLSSLLFRSDPALALPEPYSLYNRCVQSKRCTVLSIVQSKCCIVKVYSLRVVQYKRRVEVYSLSIVRFKGCTVLALYSLSVV